MTQVDPGINFKNPQKQEVVPTWYQICVNLADIACKRYTQGGQYSIYLAAYILQLCGVYAGSGDMGWT
jgi:hypothetical protein